MNKKKSQKKDTAMETTKEIATVVEPTNLSVNLNDNAVAAMKDQREKLGAFVKSQLKEGINGDFAIIPGTPKRSLLKPGAEKLANLFKLGSRIIQREREIDREGKFALFSYTVEIFHIPTGAVIAQCEGSANSEEKKNRNKPFADQLNSLGKMAQKRAYVGGIIMAVGASDFFSQDIEGAEDLRTNGHEKAEKIQAELEKEMPEPKASGGAPSCDACGAGLMRTKKNDAWFCPNWKETGTGTHSYLKD